MRQPSQPAPVPLILFSADGGRTWTRATVSGAGTDAEPGPAPGSAKAPANRLARASRRVPARWPGPAGRWPGRDPGTVPVLIAHGGSTWLALGQYAAWTSPDGRTWHPAPGLPPVAGDTVLGLAGTGTGFVAVGEHTGAQPGPVVWTSSAGRPWQRWTGAGARAHRPQRARDGPALGRRRGRCGRGRRPDRRGRRAGPAA